MASPYRELDFARPLKSLHTTHIRLSGAANSSLFRNPFKLFVTAEYA